MAALRELEAGGVRVIFQPRPGAGLVAWGMAFGCGSGHEGPGQEGYAHLLEHMAFKGPRGIPARRFLAAADGLGLRLNAGTGDTSTTFMADGLPEQIAAAAATLARSVACPALRKEDLRPEKGVVLAEMDEGLSDPECVLGDAMHRQMLVGHPRGRDIIGTRECVMTATPDALREFHAGGYRRGNAVMAVVGDIGEREALAMCREAAAFLPPGDGLPPLPPVPAPSSSEGRTPMATPACHSSLATRLRGLPDAESSIAWLLLARYLSGGLASPLPRRLREDLGIVYSVDAWANDDGDLGMFGFDWISAPEHEAEIRAAVLDELGRVAAEGLPDGGMEATRRRATADRLRSAGNPSGTMLRLLDEALAGRVPAGDDEVEGILSSMTADRVAAEAARIASGPWAFHAVGGQPS